MSVLLIDNNKHIAYKIGMTKAIELKTVAEIVRHYGRARDVAERFGQTVGNVNSWIRRKEIPPRYYLQHTAILERDGVSVSPEVWGQKAPTEAAE